MINNIKGIVQPIVLTLQAGSIIGIPALYLVGRLATQIDPVKGAQCFSKTAALSLLIGTIMALVEKNNNGIDSYSSKTEKKEADSKTWKIMAIGAALTTVGSCVYYKEFRLVHMVAATFFGSIGSFGIPTLIDKFPEYYGLVYIIQSALTAGFVGMNSIEFFPESGASAVVAYAAKTAGLSMLMGLGAGVLYDFNDKRILSGWVKEKFDSIEEKHERFWVMLLSGGVTAAASAWLHQFSVASAITYTAFGVVGSWGSYQILGKPEENIEKNNNT